ncbi:acetoin utilization protein AcuC [Dehalococcoidia bacterium]|nr:acetoin utilization protein AcuC [Dehalococcoidia bacterium]
MSKTAAFVYTNQLSRHVLREGHPMQPIRLRDTFELLESLGAFNNPGSMLVEPREATEQEILTYHTSEYIEAVKSLSQLITLPDHTRYGFSQTGDNPIYAGMYEAALLSTGASMVAMELALQGNVRVAFNPSGGLHHAMPGSASGFCIFNDPVIAIEAALARGLRVAYVDIDAHHGDGVQHAFYKSNNVLTISFHESGRYLFPGTGNVTELGSNLGLGYSVNIPLAPYTGDDLYLWAFQQVVPPLLKSFQPDVLVTQLGIDTYCKDPITHLAMTTRGFVDVVQSLAELARHIPWVALGGGGYDLSAVARCWTLAYGVMANERWPNTLPQEWQIRLGTKTLHDLEPPEIPTKEQAIIRQFVEDSVGEACERVFPYHNL